MPSRGSRMLSGLDSQHSVIDDAAHASVEHLIVDDDPPKHTTRASRNGISEVLYDMKYHPMDAVTRPNMPATRRHRSKSVSFADDQDDDSEIEHLPSSSQGATESEGSDDEAGSDSVSRRGPPPAKRRKDSQASRRSSRKEAQKFVDYDRKSHPSDYGIPGYQHKAKYTPPTDKTMPVQHAKKRKATPRDPEDEEDELLVVQPRHPRKQLKSLATNKSDNATKRGRGRPRKKPHSSDEVNALLEEAIRGSQRAPLLVSSVADSDELESDIDLVFGGNGESVPDNSRSSNTLDVSPPQDTPQAPVASSHKIPEYIFDRHALKHGAAPLTTNAAFDMILEDFRSDHDAELTIHKPYVTTVTPQGDDDSKPGAESRGYGTIKAGREVSDREDAPAGDVVDNGDEDDWEEHSSQNQNHFTEQLAITEPRDSDGSDDSVLQTLPLLSSQGIEGQGLDLFGDQCHCALEPPVHEVVFDPASTQ